MLLSFSFCLTIKAQEIAPYSRFGLGEIQSSNFATSKAMGGLAAGFRNPLYINFANPASYSSSFMSSQKLTTLELGVNFNTKSLTDGQTDSTYRTGDAFLDYIAMAFPIGKNGGGSFGIIPYSKMNYSFEEDRFDPTIGSSRKLYEGTGRLYQLYAGGAYKFHNKDTSNLVSLGLNASYVFGNLDRQELLIFPDSTQSLNTRINSTTRVSNFNLTLGAQYKRELIDNNKQYVATTVGAYSNFPVASGTDEDVLWDRFLYVSNLVAVVDTVENSTVSRSGIKTPAKIGFGITLEKHNRNKQNAAKNQPKKPNNLLVGVDFSYAFWSKFDNPSKEANLLDSWRIAAGFQYQPDFDINASLLSRMSYRFGGYYDKGYLEIDDTRISEYGITFGIGMPIKSFFSGINLSFETGKRGTRTNGLISENFFRAYIGFTLNDKWFQKYQYE